MTPARNPVGAAPGACIICDRPLPAIALRHGDPFCRTRCAREHFGIPGDAGALRVPEPTRLQRERRERDAEARARLSAGRSKHDRFLDRLDAELARLPELAHA